MKTKEANSEYLDLYGDIFETEPVSSRHQFDNQYSSFTTVHVIVRKNRPGVFEVRTEVRKKLSEGYAVQLKTKTFPIERYADFMKDLEGRRERRLTYTY